MPLPRSALSQSGAEDVPALLCRGSNIPSSVTPFTAARSTSRSGAFFGIQALRLVEMMNEGPTRITHSPPTLAYSGRPRSPNRRLTGPVTLVDALYPRIKVLVKIRTLSLTSALIIVTGFSIQGSHAGDPSWPIEVLETMDTQRIAVFPRLADVLDSPTWQPGNSPAPVGVDEAIELASRFETEKGHLSNAGVEEIKLLPINDRRADNRWYYLVKVIDRDFAQSGPHYVAVLMNGATAAAIAEPDSVR